MQRENLLQGKVLCVLKTSRDPQILFPTIMHLVEGLMMMMMIMMMIRIK
jgi:hypothetical protein